MEREAVGQTSANTNGVFVDEWNSRLMFCLLYLSKEPVDSGLDSSFLSVKIWVEPRWSGRSRVWMRLEGRPVMLSQKIRHAIRQAPKVMCELVWYVCVCMCLSFLYVLTCVRRSLNIDHI